MSKRKPQSPSGPTERAPAGTFGDAPPRAEIETEKHEDGSVTVTTAAGTKTYPSMAAAMEQVRDAITTKFGAERRDRKLNTGAQRDIEDADHAGVHPKQREKEAEVGGIAADRLRSIIERTERLEEERKALASDIKDIMAEAKSAGFDTKVIRAILVIRRNDPADVEEQETLLDLYRRALGM